MQTAEIAFRAGGELPRPSAANVVPFMRPNAGAGRVPPIVALDRVARPAPTAPARFVRTKGALFLIASLALHAGALAAFYREAPPLASVGERSISVEIVLGTDRAAGLAETPTVAEATVNSAAAQGVGPELVKPETARAEVKPAEVSRDAEPVRTLSLTEAEKVPPAAPRHKAVAEDMVAAPVLASTAPSTERALLVETTSPVGNGAAPVPTADMVQVMELPQDVALPRPRPEPRVSEAPRRRQATAREQRKDRGEDVRTRESQTSVASTASSGIGRGRSDDLTNYMGLVRAQLVRHKHYPPDAKRNGEKGRAVVSFSIAPNGTVSHVSLVRGSGFASLDHEAQASVRRAAPFPPPPSGRRVSYRVPITFDLSIR